MDRINKDSDSDSDSDSWFMAGYPILILMASLTFLFNQMSSLANTLTLSETILKRKNRGSKSYYCNDKSRIYRQRI